MIRSVIAAALALFATPAIADTIPIVDGPLVVHTGDILTSGKAVQNNPVGDVITCAKGVCPNRMGRGFFTMSGGATRLKVLTKSIGYDPDGYRYQVLDGIPALVAPVVTTPAPAKLNPFGVNLAGCYQATNGALCPNQDDIDWYTAPAQGFQLVRVAFKDVTPKATLYKSIDGLLAKGATVVMDRHQFTWDTAPNQIAYWIDKAAPYKTNTRVVIDFMNEPRNFNDPVVTNDWVQWAADTKAIIAGLRAAGFQNTFAVEWPGSSAAFRFDKHEPSYKACESAACAMDRQGGLGDTNILLEGHMYWDKGSTGTHWECDPASGMWYDALRAGAAARGLKAYMGEGAGGNAGGVQNVCAGYLAQAVAEVKAHPETWFGVTWWGAGREWPEAYPLKIEPKKGTRAAVPHSAYLEQLRGK
ncbi:cellulase family glycosylhydrolase [Sphingomonas sp. BAUL-RG-20F-R05-02]|uniref:cellulase family glycosylhydrolase n=1 Tax=Sphingomonas sp. BAUL-RG-20F-R05-02 TaxID=2914830 RepID=UPI001F576A5A|nr:cellulase family glycosylhydrolase [Sphingomonas sp. BAUL-RG-20F-R05-02]